MRRRLSAGCVAAIFAALVLSPAAHAGPFSFTSAMQAAARARGVPLPLLEAISYVNARWEVSSKQAGDGGYGPMNILPKQLAQAAALGGYTADQVNIDPTANLDAGAALLSRLHNGAGADLASWRPAVATMLGDAVATQVFDALRSGESRTTSLGETIVLPAESIPGLPAVHGAAGVATTPGSDYPPASWVPASASNFSVANRPHDYPVDMVVIHDIEGSYGSAIQHFQDPAAQASAHYVVSDLGQITQMVSEKDIAWHAGNWDYNTRAIGIEHEGFATGPNWYTPAMYQASAHLIASICSRWGVPMDRAHVIGHYQVPDPNNPGQFGGAGHHTDPGTNWDWTGYMSLAQSYAATLPSPPHLAPDPAVVEGDKTATVNWLPAHTCRTPIDSYTVVGQPGNLTQTLPGSATSAVFNGLTNGVAYTFTVTAHNVEGQDVGTASPVTPGKPWASRESVSPSVGSGPSVASWGPNRLDVFYRGTDAQLWHQHQQGGAWSAPEALGGILTSAPAAVSWGGERLDIFVRGADMQLWHLYWSGTAWGGWEPLGGILSTAPSVTAWSVNRLDIFAGGSDNQLWHQFWSGTRWGGWDPLGGILTASPATASWSANRIDVFVRGSDYALWHRFWYGVAWSSWILVGGSLASAPAVSTWAPGRLDIFSVTDSGTIQHLSGDGSPGSVWQNLAGGSWQDDPAAIARKVGTIDLFGLAADSSLWHVSYLPG